MGARRDELRVFFPWERRRGVASLFIRARARQILLVLVAVGGFVLLHGYEHRVRCVRATRATIATASSALSAWRADHDRTCPGSLADLVAAGYLAELPRDAWGRVLRVTCPGRKDPRGFDVSSDGPDGEPGGLDRVE
ncbi:MAG TPA: type II secretion system protein GspG [Polyangiaceae bacterium]|nr:type II secretion system protein GspG [Polyangiaceae bacterium]